MADDDSHDRANTIFDAVWKTLGLEAAGDTVAGDRTLTDRSTSALRGTDASEAPATPRAPAPPLPRISIDDHREGGAAPSSRVVDFEIIDTLGEGGMGRVHLARQRSLERDVAIKTVKAKADSSVAELLLREAVFTGRLEHPSIIPIHAIGRDDDGQPVLVMKRVEGVSWHALLRDDAHPAWAHIDGANERLVANIGILMQVCNALELAHQRGIVHRDLKPANVMVGELGEVYLLDFGIATPIETRETERSSRPRHMVGTPAYMAPEMVAGDPVDARTDVYLLGSTLHEVLTKRRRHEGTSIKGIIRAAFESEPFSYETSVPVELAELANAATSLDRAKRPQSALAFKQALQPFLAHRGSRALALAAEQRLADARKSATDAQRAHELLTESRFGFTQALREWPDDAQARRGLNACLEAMIEREISTEDVAGARALLRELGEARPALEAKIAELEASLRERREEGKELRNLRHDFNPTVATRSTSILFFVAAAFSLLLTIQLVVQHRQARDDSTIIAVPVVIMVVLATTALIFRKRVLQTALSRRIVAAVFVSIVVMLANRVVGVLTHTPGVDTLPNDLLIVAATTATVAITTARAFAAVPPLAIGAYAFSRVFPEHTLPAFALTMCFVAIIGGVSGLRIGRSA